jgi:hypothetical protein
VGFPQFELNRSFRDLERKLSTRRAVLRFMGNPAVAVCNESSYASDTKRNVKLRLVDSKSNTAYENGAFPGIFQRDFHGEVRGAMCNSEKCDVQQNSGTFLL